MENIGVQDLICIACPIGCRIKVQTNEDQTYKVTGNLCKRGEVYGIEEVTDPKRMVTTTIRVEDGYLNLIPVKTKEPIPKGMMMELMRSLDDVIVKAPIKVGDIIVPNALNLGIDIVATRNMPKK